MKKKKIFFSSRNATDQFASLFAHKIVYKQCTNVRIHTIVQIIYAKQLGLLVTVNIHVVYAYAASIQQ